MNSQQSVTTLSAKKQSAEDLLQMHSDSCINHRSLLRSSSFLLTTRSACLLYITATPLCGTVVVSFLSCSQKKGHELAALHGGGVVGGRDPQKSGEGSVGGNPGTGFRCSHAGVARRFPLHFGLLTC